jgi:uncharacterized protein (TIGR03084 family)
MSRLDTVLADLAVEGDRLEALVAPLAADGWRAPTPAEGWTVAHQVAHLAWTDEAAVAAATDPAAWDLLVQQALEHPDGFVDAEAARGAAAAGPVLLTRWRASRSALARAHRPSRGPEAAVVRAADERDVDGHRAVHGDLGARAGRGRCARRGAAA